MIEHDRLAALALRLRGLPKDVEEASRELTQRIEAQKRIEGLFVDQNGNLTEAGLAVIARGREINAPQADIARLLGVTRGAVWQQIRKLDRLDRKR